MRDIHCRFLQPPQAVYTSVPSSAGPLIKHTASEQACGWARQLHTAALQACRATQTRRNLAPRCKR